MNITPEQIPDDVVEAAAKAMAVIDWDWLLPNEQERHLINARVALAAALPVLLGEPVAWMANNGDVMSARSRSTCTRASSLSRYHIALVCMPETPNAHP